MENLNDIFQYIKRSGFLRDFADINPDAGISHRFKCKGRKGSDKNVGLTTEDKAQIKAGLQKFVGEVNSIVESL